MGRKFRAHYLVELANQHVASIESQITFNVGGTLFITTKDTLLRVKDSYFTSMMESGLWKPQADGTYFIDRSPICFGRIVDYMRYDTLNTTDLSEAEEDMLLVDFDYFFPKSMVPAIPNQVPNDRWMSKYAHILQDWLGKPLDVSKCLYKASKDGFTAKAFHERCDKKGPTLTVVQSREGWIFGGYNSTSWQSTGDFTNSKHTFLFTLKNPNRIPPTRYFCKASYYPYAVFNGAECGPVFPDGLTTMHPTTGPRIDFPTGYEDTTGFGRSTFTGNHGTFEAADVEVFTVPSRDE